MATTIVLPARFVRDWLDSYADEELPPVEVHRESDRSIKITAADESLADLRARAECYVEETFDEPYLRGIQSSARAVLRRLTA